MGKEEGIERKIEIGKERKRGRGRERGLSITCKSGGRVRGEDVEIYL